MIGCWPWFYHVPRVQQVLNIHHPTDSSTCCSNMFRTRRLCSLSVLCQHHWSSRPQYLPISQPEVSTISVAGKVESLAWSVTGSILAVSFDDGETSLYKEPCGAALRVGVGRAYVGRGTSLHGEPALGPKHGRLSPRCFAKNKTAFSMLVEHRGHCGGGPGRLDRTRSRATLCTTCFPAPCHSTAGRISRHAQASRPAC